MTALLPKNLPVGALVTFQLTTGGVEGSAAQDENDGLTPRNTSFSALSSRQKAQPVKAIEASTTWAWSVGSVASVNPHGRLVTVEAWDPPRREGFSESDAKFAEILAADIDQREKAIKAQQQQLDEAIAAITAKSLELRTHGAGTQAKLDEVTPFLDAARAALDQLTSTELREVRSYQTPPESVKRVLECVMAMLGSPGADWDKMRAFLRRDDAITSILEHNPEKITDSTLSTVEKYLLDPELNAERAQRASKASGAMFQWVAAQVRYCRVLVEVRPLQNELKETRDKLHKLEEEKALLTAALADAVRDLRSIRRKYAKLLYGEASSGASGGEDENSEEERAIPPEARSKAGVWYQRSSRLAFVHVDLKACVIQLLANGVPQTGTYNLLPEEVPPITPPEPAEVQLRKDKAVLEGALKDQTELALQRSKEAAAAKDALAEANAELRAVTEQRNELQLQLQATQADLEKAQTVNPDQLLIPSVLPAIVRRFIAFVLRLAFRVLAAVWMVCLRIWGRIFELLGLRRVLPAVLHPPQLAMKTA